ncbi:CapA family protein [Actinomadura sp. 6N118]|uniref:CapA family protein n=1 Tax=Actinomadura sp. 6N118 TaxID=3375151 RepID=UPI0037B28DC8
MRIGLCGDVMLGRGVDQILPHPGDSVLRETSVRDARTYVELAEAANGPIPRPVGFGWPWGAARAVMAAADARLVNLETGITRSGAFAPHKSVHYRMSPANAPALATARPDVCTLANNHVLDFGRPGLEETLDCLDGLGLHAAGAGRDLAEAHRPAIVPVDHGRVVVFAFGTASSGIDPSWAATADRAGVAFIDTLSAARAAEINERVRQARRPGDIVVVSVHWGSNWGYDVPEAQIHFAHALIDGGVDVVHGHSSHHPRPLEIYRGKLILYGCGDFIDDYEGIDTPHPYRDDLRPLYLASIDAVTDTPADLRIIPMQARKMSLQLASRDDTEDLAGLLNEISAQFGTRIAPRPDGDLAVS